MTRGGRIKDRETGPDRRCIASGEVRPAEGLIRFVVGPEAQIVPDIAGKLPGRGIWVTASRAAIEKATGKNLFARAAKAKVSVPADLADQVESLLADRVINLVSLARKSGLAVAGYEKVKDLLQKEEAEVLIQAEDGSQRGKSKLSTPHYGTYIGWLAASELGRAFGRDKVIHAALGAGGLTNRVVEDARRLKGMRAMGVAQDAAAGAAGKDKRAS
ncbi:MULTISPECIES: RNA-binding protein [unclassified Roseivivax]|uniref:RNA-binding protein n=1 Tax=Roseivivax sp. GX 12232 TaxID=2900547 RepID=UPI001E5F2864|nr:RNA-binding protein [Roseivivax sp. GX 12232]